MQLDRGSLYNSTLNASILTHSIPPKRPADPLPPIADIERILKRDGCGYLLQVNRRNNIYRAQLRIGQIEVTHFRGIKPFDWKLIIFKVTSAVPRQLSNLSRM